ncbi:hypothetical protein CFOL_v3_19274 [Cephalotus follicularis]|uniref:Uncharacterized protein n=1 Tax=Cephalotus follicularis TaxID=3775 RepID=A0A1Q3C6T7_CEPFO|nr:hypothetical protein CFOL_v3_19274 [Cephalotus follicularis]
MADLLMRAEKYVNAEEEMAARKQKTPWPGHRKEKREHARNAPERKEKRKERSELTKEDLRHKLSRRKGSPRGCKSPKYYKIYLLGFVIIFSPFGLDPNL